jgi:hypothetical protein
MTDVRHTLRFSARMNISYHEGLERFYGQWLGWSAFISLILSSAAFAALSNLVPPSLQPFRDWLLAALALTVTVLNGGVLAFGMRGKFITHAELKRKWIDFLGQVETAQEAELVVLERKLHELNAQEPASDPRRLNRAYENACTMLGVKPV